MSDSVTPWAIARQAPLCPWDSPGKNTGVGCLALLQEFFPTQGSNPGLLHCRQILYCLRQQGSPQPRVGHLKKKKKNKPTNNWHKLKFSLIFSFYYVKFLYRIIIKNMLNSTRFIIPLFFRGHVSIACSITF